MPLTQQNRQALCSLTESSKTTVSTDKILSAFTRAGATVERMSGGTSFTITFAGIKEIVSSSLTKRDRGALRSLANIALEQHLQQ